MVTIRSKAKTVKVYQLTCAIPVLGAKPVKSDTGLVTIATERALTLQPGEKRSNLPPAVLDCPSIQKAIALKEIKVLEANVPTFDQKPTVVEAAAPVAVEPEPETTKKPGQSKVKPVATSETPAKDKE